jgi:hypothetical protein
MLSSSHVTGGNCEARFYRDGFHTFPSFVSDVRLGILSSLQNKISSVHTPNWRNLDIWHKHLKNLNCFLVAGTSSFHSLLVLLWRDEVIVA